MSEVMQKGIGAAFHINAETRAFRDFFSTLRNSGIQTILPSDAHVTIVDCAETQIPIFSKRDQMSLNRARSRASEYLATVPYYELVLTPEEPKLEVFGRRLGVLVSETDFMETVRGYIAGIFNDEAGVSLSNRGYVPHLSVGMKTRGAKSAAKRIARPRIPRSMHLIGHDVSERVYTHDPGRTRSSQSYVNSGSRLRVNS